MEKHITAKQDQEIPAEAELVVTIRLV